MIWLPFVVLLILAGVIIFHPLLKPSGKNYTSQQALNISLHREALADLNLRLKQDEINQNEYEQLNTELQRRLLDDSTGALDEGQIQKEISVADKKLAMTIFTLAFIFVLIASGALYKKLGAWQEVEISGHAKSLFEQLYYVKGEPKDPERKAAKQLVQKIPDYLKTHDTNLYMVYILASAYTELGLLDQAIPLYKKYLMAIPTDEMVLTEYVQVLYMAAGRQLTERVRFVVDRALTLNPHNLRVLDIMAMHHYQAQEYSLAIDFWQRVLVTMPEASEEYKMISGYIEQAKLAQNQAKNE